MSFKNAIKNLIAHFGTVWSLLLYIAVCSLLIVGLSLPFVLPIYRTLDEAGVFVGVSEAFSSLFNDGGWQGLWTGLYSVYETVIGVFKNNSTVVSLTRAFVILIVVLAFRLFFGLYEIPLATVLDGKMSCNADFGLGGKFFSTFFVSIRYSLAKMPVMIAFDAATFGLIYGCIVWLGMSVMLPFVVILIIVVIRAFRSSMLACWAPSVAGGMGVIKGFARSIELCFKNFGTIYSTYIVTWMLIVALSMFVTIFTLGVGLIVAVPFFCALLGYMGITVYYNKEGKKYYIDGSVFTPPPAKVTEKKQEEE